MLLRTIAPVPFLGLSRDLSRLALGDFARTDSDSWIPAVDVHETAEAIVFTAELPGIAKDKVEVSFHENVLTIAGTKESTRKSEPEKGVHLEERTFGSFKRGFRLPGDVDASRIEAVHENGLLTVTVPRKAVVQPAKIAIK